MSLLLLPLFAKPLVSRVPPAITLSLQPSSGSPGYWSLPSSHAHLMDSRSMFALCLALPAVSRLLMPHLRSDSDSVRLNEIVQANQTNGRVENQIDQADRRIYFAATLTFCLDSIRSIGPGHDHSRCTQSLAIFALAHCARRYTKMQLTYFSQTG